MARKAKDFANKRVTSQDVALEAGVSMSTVGMVLRDDPRITEKTKIRVRKAVQKLRYRPRAAAGMLAGGKTHSIGVIFSRTAFAGLVRIISQFAPIIETMGDLLTERDYIIHLSTWYQPEPSEHKQDIPLPRSFRESGLDGAILIWPPVDDTLEQTLRETMLPYVVLDAPPAPGRCAVSIDEKRAMEMVVEHLVELGHTHIHFQGASGLPEPSINSATSAWEYSRGYLAAMEAARLKPMPGWDDKNSGHNEWEDRLASLFEDPGPPTAIICYDSHMAMATMSWLMAQGLSMPGEVSVVSMLDRPDVNLAIEQMSQLPSLTSKSDMHEEISAVAVNTLLEMIESDHLIPHDCTPDPLIIEPHLMIRESTGPPPK